ncbi:MULTISPECIES: DUF397 domain-containing protein [Actinokineospora]|uniref:DUF397 domain-containing protein n=1 Tax=Actinokineospora fastidiosa TaxID=1816 RepID=A0A918G6W5_9PSEU|nr:MULTISPECIES: DUF397 domain-containing protein [Actinokineospora]UVS82396.1 hypothetical protein Actkin_06165 [Actinokineospora sp. UTMC 2448]GGS21544.1 hypothetical protein GCM10010171_12830 [Actinokineospora fastidiosa]
MTSPTTWRKATRSQNGPTCVEVAGSLDRLRDSKHTGPVLRADVPALVRYVKRD